MAAPAFVKNPKFIGGTIIVLWVAYVVYWNYRLEPIDIQLFPFIKPAQLSVSSVIIGAALFGCLATLAIQFFWRRGGSNNGAHSSTALRRQHQNRRLSAGLEHGRVGRADQQRVGARERAEDSRSLVAGRSGVKLGALSLASARARTRSGPSPS